MVIEESLPFVVNLLRHAAEAGGVVAFKQFHAVFDGDTSDRDKYDTLEAAATALAPLEVAIYTALLAKKSDNCPGSGFYDTFIFKRPEEYNEIADREHPTTLSLNQRIQIATLERARVYRHAKQGL